MITSRILFQTLQQIPAFRNLNESECHQLTEVAQELCFAPGVSIIEQGKTSQNLWIVLEGKCQVVRTTAAEPIVLADFEPFNLFGEMSFFSPAPHSASVVAKTKVRLLSIARVDYDDLIRDGVVAAYKLAYNVIESVATRLRRMDEWVTELTAADVQLDGAAALPEWHQFREKMFDGWNL